MLKKIICYIVFLGNLAIFYTCFAQEKNENQILREKFIQEYPSSSKKLELDVSQLTGNGQYLFSSDFHNKENESDQKWVDFSFFISDGKLRLDRNIPAEIVEKSKGNYTSSLSIVVANNTAFSVKDSLTDQARISELSHQPSGFIARELGVYWRNSVDATYSFWDRPIREWINESGFDLQNFSWQNKAAGLVNVEFSYNGSKLFKSPSDKPDDFLAKGFFVFDTNKNWALVRSDYQYKYTYGPDKKVDGEGEKVDIVLTTLEDKSVLPKEVKIVHTGTGNDGWNDGDPYIVLYSKIIKFNEIKKEKPSEAVFLPKDMGVKDPGESSINMLLFFNLGVILLILGIWIFRKFSKQSQA